MTEPVSTFTRIHRAPATTAAPKAATASLRRQLTPTGSDVFSPHFPRDHSQCCRNVGGHGVGNCPQMKRCIAEVFDNHAIDPARREGASVDECSIENPVERLAHPCGRGKRSQVHNA